MDHVIYYTDEISNSNVLFVKNRLSYLSSTFIYLKCFSFIMVSDKNKNVTFSFISKLKYQLKSPSPGSLRYIIVYKERHKSLRYELWFRILS